MFSNLLQFIVSSSVVLAESSREAKLSPKDMGVLRKSSNVTLPDRNSGMNLQAQEMEPAIVFCTASDCSGDCIGFLFEEGPFDNCEPILLSPTTGATPYLSLFLSDPHLSDDLPDVIGVGNDCLNLFKVPDINTCFDLNPAAVRFATFPKPEALPVSPEPAQGGATNIWNIGTSRFITLESPFTIGPNVGANNIIEEFAPSQLWIPTQATDINGKTINVIKSNLNQSLFWSVDGSGVLIAGESQPFNLTFHAIPDMIETYIMVASVPGRRNVTLTVQNPQDNTSQVVLAESTGDLTEVWSFRTILI